MNSALTNKEIKRNTILAKLEKTIPSDRLTAYLMDEKLKILSSINLVSSLHSLVVEYDGH